VIRVRGATLVAILSHALALASPAAHAQSTEGLGIPSRPAETPPPGEVEAKRLSKVPKQTKFVEAEYPKEAQEKGLEADVVLLLDINAQGTIDSVGIVTPAEPAGMGFDEAAMVAAQQFEFEPAEMDGQKIAVQISYKYKFRLKAKAPTPPPGSPPATPGAPAPGTPVAPTPPPPPQIVNLAGVLRERGTRLPMAGVLVTVFRDDGEKPVGFEATTDAKGAFQFFDLAPGDWKLLSEPPGYFPYRTTETIKPGERLDVVYYVERGEYNPYDVTVTATRPRKEVSRTTISAAELDKTPGTFGDPLAVIQNFAGVARPPPFSGLLIIRGSAPEDSRVFFSGVETPLLYHFGGLRTVMPVGVIDSLDFYPGNFSPMYGRAIGGIIDVQLKKLQPKKIGGYADVNLFDAGVYLEVPLGNKGGVAISGRRAYIDVLLNAAVPDNAPVNLIQAPVYYDYQFLANYRPAPAHDLRLFIFGSDDRLALLFKNPGALSAQLSNSSLSFSTVFYRFLVSYGYVPNDRIDNSLRLSFGHDAGDVSFGQLAFSIGTYSTQLRETLRVKVANQVTLVAGIDGMFNRTDVFVRLPLPPKEGEPPPDGPPDLSMLRTTDRKGINEWLPAAFVEAEWKPLPKLLVLPGLRVDYFGAIGQTKAQPRLTTRFGITDRWTLKGGVGLFYQEPTPDETDPSFGNPNLGAERAIHYSVGAEFKPRPFLTIDTTLFYKSLSDLVSQTDATFTNSAGEVRPVTYDNNGTGRVFGAELIVRHDFNNNFSGWIAYTLSRSTRRDSGSSEDRLFDYDQTHILTLIASYLLPRNWQIGGRFRLISGNPITPVTGSVYNASIDRYFPTYGPPNSDRLPFFSQLDVRVDKRWIYQGWILNLYLDIQNVTNRTNTENRDYNFNYSQSKPQQGLPILPILGIRADY
jgi:TonB family protein